MKKLLLILTLVLAPSSHAFDLGLHGGVTMNYAAPGLNYFTYGLSGTFYFGSFSAGLKLTNLSGPSATSGGYTITTGQLNFLGQFKYQLGGFFAGLNLGLGSTSLSLSYYGVGATAAQSAFIFGPTIGYYFGTKTKFGIEVDYLLCTATGWVNTIVPMVGVKFPIGGADETQAPENAPKPEPAHEPEPETQKEKEKKAAEKHKDLPTMDSLTPEKE